MRRPLRGLLAAVLALTTVTAMAATSQAAEVTGDAVGAEAAEIDRNAGATRADTAAQAALDAFPDGVEEALVARSDDFPDALAAAYFAGVADVPVLLTDRESIPSVTLDALEELGVQRLSLLGQETAIPAEIEAAFADAYGEDNVGRIGGGDRFETAALLARSGRNRVGTAPNLTDPEGEPLRTAIVSLGTNFPDALSAGPLAFANEHPILLTGTDTLPEITQFTLQDAELDIEQVIVTGGPVAISDGVVEQLAGFGNLDSVVRVAGGDRAATAVEIGLVTRQTLGWDAGQVALATGSNFPDALTLAPLAASEQATLFLSQDADSLGWSSFTGINALCNAVDTILVAGGELAVGPTVAQQARLATTCATSAFPISGGQEFPAEGDTDADGDGYVFADGEDLCYAYRVNGLDEPAQAAHIHGAVFGVAGPVDTAVELPDANGFAAGCATDDEIPDGATRSTIAELSRAIADFPAGYYLNIHTESFPAGAARGQLVPPIAFTVEMTGDLEVTVDDDGAFTGLVEDPAAGFAELTLFGDDEEVCWTIDVDRLESPVDPAIGGGLHLHAGAADQNGPIILPLGAGPVGRTDFTFTDCMPTDAEAQDGLFEQAGAGIYANLHTVDRPAGALRGQLAGEPLTIFGDAEVDDSDPENPVFGQGEVNQNGEVSLLLGAEPEGDAPRNVCVQVRWPNGLPDGETIGHPDKDAGIHVHTGRVDQNGAIQIAWDGLDGQRDGATCTAVEESVLQSVLADPEGHYVNVHSSSYVDGIARAQLNPDVLALTLSGDQEVDTDSGELGVGDLTAAGSGGAFQASDANPDVVCASFVADGLDRVVGAHLHEGELGENGDIVVPFSDERPEGGVFQAAFGCRTDTPTEVATAIFDTPDAFYMNVHTEAFPMGAIRGQLADLSLPGE